MTRLTRIVAVTIGLIGAGVLVGAATGVAALGLAVALTDGISKALDSELLTFAGLFGAAIGAVAAPAAGWLLLRRVPLGSAITWTSAGAAAGGVGGWLIGLALRSQLGGSTLVGDEIELGLIGAVVGFAAAAVLVRRLRSVRSDGAGTSERQGA